MRSSSNPHCANENPLLLMSIGKGARVIELTFSDSRGAQGRKLIMNEAARRQRNQQRLTECLPKFAQRVKAVISDLETRGFRPLIQDAHRSLVKIAFDPTPIKASGLSINEAKGEARSA